MTDETGAADMATLEGHTHLAGRTLRGRPLNIAQQKNHKSVAQQGPPSYLELEDGADFCTAADNRIPEGNL